MAFTPTYVQVAPNSTGGIIDGAQVTDGANTAMRQIIVLGDPSTAANVQTVKAGGSPPAAADMAAVVVISPNQQPLPAVGYMLDGSSAAGVAPVFIGGFDPSGNVQPIATDLLGRLQSGSLSSGVSTTGDVTTLNDNCNPAAVSLVGDPTGDFQNVNLLEAALSGDLPLQMIPGNPGQLPSSGCFPVVLAADQAQDTMLVAPGRMWPINTAMFLVDTMAGGATSWRSFALEIIGNVSISAGAITVQGSNSGQANSWVTLPVFDMATITGTAIQAAITIAASTFRFFSGKIPLRYLRVFVTTAFAGGTCAGLLRLSSADVNPNVTSVGQPTAANLNVTAAIAGAQTLATVSTLSAITAGPAIASGFYSRITDGVTVAAVKAASAAAVAADPAMVVAISPNNAVAVNITPTTAAAQALSALNVNASGALTALKATAGNLYGFSMLNNTASPVFLEFWNIAAGSVTLGTTAPTQVYVIPANGTLTVIADTAQMNGAAAMSYAAVTAYNGSTPASVSGSIFFK